MAWIRWYASNYVAATQSLTLLEHGAYITLLNQVFCTRKPLPPDLELAYRVCRASTEEERSAVKNVLTDKFQLVENGWTHDRAFKELENAQEAHEKRAASGSLGGIAKALLSEKFSIATNDDVAKSYESESESDKEQNNTSKKDSTIGVSFEELPEEVKDVIAINLGIDLEPVWDYYLQETGKSPKQNTFTTARKRQLHRRYCERLKVHEGDTRKAKLDLRHAIDALVASDFHNARGEHKGKKKFNSFEIIFRSQSQFEKWLPEGEEE